MKIIQFFIVTFLFVFHLTAFSQTYLEQHKKCSEILDGATLEDSRFWTKLDLRNKCLVGLKAPNFSIKTLDGSFINSDSLQGKVLFLNFWFTKCIPCIHEIPELNKLVTNYKEKDVVFLSFANEDSIRLQQFLKSQNFTFKHVPNGSRIMIDTFKLFSIWPTTVIIDKQGRIQFIKVGELNNKKDHHKILLDKLLSQNVVKNQIGVKNAEESKQESSKNIHQIPTSFENIKGKINGGSDFTFIYLFKPWCKPCVDNFSKLQAIKSDYRFKVVMLTTAKENVNILSRYNFDTTYYFDPLIYKTHTLDFDEYDQFTSEVFNDAKIIEPPNRVKVPAVFVFNRDKKLVYFNEDENSTELEFEKIINLK